MNGLLLRFEILICKGIIIIKEKRAVNLILNSFTITEIWDALRAAAEADLNLAQAIVDSAGVIVTSADMTTCYDERGIFKYLF